MQVNVCDDDHNLLADIPEEVLIDHFLPFLPHQLLISLKATNHYFNKLIWDYWIKYKTTYVIPYGMRCGKLENVANYFVSKLENLTEITAARSIDIDENYGDELDDFSLFQMLKIVSGKIRKLDFGQCDSLCGNFIQDIIKHKIPLFYTLEELLIKDLDFELTGLTLKPFPNLKKVSLTGNEYAVVTFEDFIFPSSLVELDMSHEVSEDFILDIPNQCPNLTSLHIRVNDETAKKLITALPQLTSFHMYIDSGGPDMTNEVFSVFKQRGTNLNNLTSLTLPYNVEHKFKLNPFGIYAERITDLSLFFVGEQGNDEEQDVLLNSLVCLKNLKKLALNFEELGIITFSDKVLKSLSTNSTLKNLECLSCSLASGAACIIPILVDTSLQEITLKGNEDAVDFSFLTRCPNIEKLFFDVRDLCDSNLEQALIECRDRKIFFSKLEHVGGIQINSRIVELLSNKEKIKTLDITYSSPPISLKEFKSLKSLQLFLETTFPIYPVLPVSVNSLMLRSISVSGDQTGFASNILTLENLRSFKVKMENLKDHTVTEICKNDSPIEEMLIRDSKFLTNNITKCLTQMQNLRNLVIVDCREFKDCNEISLLEYEKNFHLFSSKVSDRKFDFYKAYAAISKNLRLRFATDALFEGVFSNLFPQLLSEGKLIEIYFYCCGLVDRTKKLKPSPNNGFLLAYYLLLSTIDYSPISQFHLLNLLLAIENQFNGQITQEQRSKLRYCLSKALPNFASDEWVDGTFRCASLLLDLDGVEKITKNMGLLLQLLVVFDSPAPNHFITEFMDKCSSGEINVLQEFTYYDLSTIISRVSTNLQVRSSPSFHSFCRLVARTYCFNINSSVLIDNHLNSLDLMMKMSNPFSNLAEEVRNEKMSHVKIDPLDESIPVREKVATIVDPSWATEDTFNTCIDVRCDLSIELFKKIKSSCFEAFGFKWTLSIQNGEYLGEVTTSLHLESTHPEEEQDKKNQLVLDYLKVKVAFINFNFDPTNFIVRTHKFQFKDDNVADTEYYEKAAFSKTEHEHNYRTVICMKLLKKEMKPMNSYNNNNHLSNNSNNNSIPLNSLSPNIHEYPSWISRQISKNRPIIHHTVNILTPTNILVNDGFSSDRIDVFGNGIIFYIIPKSRKSGLFAIDLSDEFMATDMYKVKYLIANQSFDADSTQIGKYNRCTHIKEDENYPYRDSENDYNLVEPSFYQPTIIEREPGKFFNKYVIQLVFVLVNTAQGLDIGDPYDDAMSDDSY